MRLNGPGPLDRPLSRSLSRPASRRRPGVRLPLAAVIGVVLSAGVPLLLAADAGAAPSALAAARTALPAPPAPPAPPVNNQLTITVDDGAGKVTTSRLDCGPDQDTPSGTTVSGEPAAPSAGTAPSAPAATSLVGPARSVADSCDRLEQLGGPLGPVPAGQMCSMIYGGAQTAQVTGTWHGVPVEEKYSRANGCEVARWNRMAPVLPTGTGGA